MLLIISLLSTQCKKETVPDIPQNSIPVFNVDGTLGDEAISLHAGQKNAFMHTTIDQLNNVNLYSGELSDGETVFKVQVFPSNVDVPSLNNNFTEKDSYAIARPFGSEPLLMISIQDFPFSDLINDIDWTVDNEQQAGSTLKINEPGKYSVCANIHFSNGETENICNTIIVGYELHANYQLNYTADSIIKANIIAPDNSISKVSWYINNVLQSNDLDFQTADTPEKFNLKAEIEFDNGVVGIREAFINKLDPGYSIPDFTTLGQKSNYTWDNTIKVTIVKNGNTFISNNGAAGTSHFDITKISNYNFNSKGNEVKLIDGTLKSPFKDSNTGVILNGDFKIEIGVAY